VPGVGNRRQDPARGHTAEGPVHGIPEHHPGTDRGRDRCRREHEQHRHQDELGGDDVAGADGEFDTPDEGIDRDQQDGRTGERSDLASVGMGYTGREQERASDGHEQRRRNRVDEQLAL
jgi:hypothetical protein